MKAVALTVAVKISVFIHVPLKVYVSNVSVRFFKGGGRTFAVGLNGGRNMNSALTRYCMYSLSAKSLCTGNIDAMLFVLHLWRGRDVSVLECCVVCFFVTSYFHGWGLPQNTNQAQLHSLAQRNTYCPVSGYLHFLLSASMSSFNGTGRKCGSSLG